MKSGGGKTVGHCEMALNSWETTFACPNSSSSECVIYYATEADCMADAPSVRADRNNVKACRIVRK